MKGGPVTPSSSTYSFKSSERGFIGDLIVLAVILTVTILPLWCIYKAAEEPSSGKSPSTACTKQECEVDINLW